MTYVIEPLDADTGDEHLIQAHSDYKLATSAVKNRMLALYGNDKSCKWIQSFGREIYDDAKQENSAKHGWMSRTLHWLVLLWEVLFWRVLG